MTEESQLIMIIGFAPGRMDFGNHEGSILVFKAATPRADEVQKNIVLVGNCFQKVDRSFNNCSDVILHKLCEPGIITAEYSNPIACFAALIS